MVRFRSSKEIAEQGQRQGSVKLRQLLFPACSVQTATDGCGIDGSCIDHRKGRRPAFFSFRNSPDSLNVNSTSTDANLPNETLSEPLLAHYGVFDTSHLHKQTWMFIRLT